MEKKTSRESNYEEVKEFFESLQKQNQSLKEKRSLSRSDQLSLLLESLLIEQDWFSSSKKEASNDS